MDRIEMIRQRLQRLEPIAIEIVDDSASHAGHEGAKSGGGHFNVTIVSAQFDGEALLARHRMVYDAIGDAMQTEIHALSIKALTPQENDK